MANDDTQPALLVRRKSDGVEFGVSERHYEDRLNDEEFEDAGSTDLSVDAVPLHSDLPIPKISELKAAGIDTVGELRGYRVEDLADLDGIGKKSAKRIVKVLADA